MTDRKVFELAISLFTFLNLSEKKKLCKNFSELNELFNLNLKDLSFLIGRSLRVKNFTGDKLKIKLEKALRIMENYKINLISVFDNDYPKSLNEIDEQPFAIFSRGEKINEQRRIAIVGTREPTGKGMQFAFDMAKELSEKNIVIVSGMAIGIDAFAHKGAVTANAKTIAVLPCGVENLYPMSNIALARKIVDRGGTILSEYPPETMPLKFRFLERNRIISALSEGTIIIEAPKKSGALSTAEHARTQGRPIFVFEEMLNSNRNEGGRNLNAHIVNSSDEVLEVLNNECLHNKNKTIEKELFSVEELNL